VATGELRRRRTVDVSDLRGLGDVLIDVEVEQDEVRSALCALLSLPAETVAVVESYEDLAAHAPEATVACLVARLFKGDFPTLLSLFAEIKADIPRIVTAARLCRLLRCRCLVDDGSNNPYTFLLVDAAGSCRWVSVDVDRWDRHEYVIDRMEPLP
jgi:hypothetical protein